MSLRCQALSLASLQPSLYKLQKLLDKTLVEFVDGVWTIKDFINQFNSMAIKADVEDRDNFLNQINEQIALSVRDYFLAEKAKRMHLYKSKNVQKQLEMWRNKFVYNEMRQYLSAGSKIYEPKTSDENENAKNNFREDRIALLSNIDSLKTQYSIKINEAILDTIITIDSEKSRWHSLQVFTKSNNRLAIPVVDPALLLDN